MAERYVEGAGISQAWGLAMLNLVRSPGRERIGLTVAVTGADTKGVLAEEASVRETLDRFLVGRRKWPVRTVASTIFPEAQWNRDLPRKALFDRYLATLPRLRRVKQNQHGTYFGRMITNGPKGKENQLDFALTTYLARPSVRRSVLQVAVFDPHQDHSAAAMRGFPCLQHLSFVPDRASSTLSVNAFYATQYMVSRAYGNYLGLGRLGRFVAHELGLELVRITCQIGVAELDVTKGSVRDLARLIDGAMD